MKENLQNNKQSSAALLANHWEKYYDQQFLKLMDQEAIKVDDQYIVHLPLKSKDVNLPNNRVLALKRLNCFHRRFLKDN